MSIISTQSDIAEVRDQMSLDYADGKYLNVVTANLGLQRPPFGFSDAQWRAIARVIALQYKQIKTKFEAVLEIILGPKVTQCGAFSADVLAGAVHAQLVGTAQFPQVGTMVIDEGLPTEETADYIFIDRYTNTVYFKDPLTQNHTAVGTEWESGVISDFTIGATHVNVFDANGFPNPGTQYTLNLGRGTAYETAGPITAVGLDARKLTIPASSKGGTGATAVAGIQVKQDGLASQINTFYVTMQDVDQMLIEGGWIQSGDLSTVFTATAGTTTSVSVAGPISADRYGGFWIRFNGDVTTALTNVIAYIEDNTTTVFTFGNTLAVPPVAGDTFTVLGNFQYIRASETDHSVLLKRELPDLMRFPKNVEFSLLTPTMTAAIAQVQVKGVAWDVFQTDPHHVEILLPIEFLRNDLRSASYIRETFGTGLLPPPPTADAIRNIGDTDISVTSTQSLSFIGVTEVAGAVRYAYYNPTTRLTADVPIGGTVLPVLDTSQFFPTGTINILGTTMLYTVTGDAEFTVPPLAAAVRVTDIVRDEKRIRLAKGLTAPVAVSDTVANYGNYDSGDIWNVDDVWPGPYVWDLFAETHKKETTPGNGLTITVSGPANLAVDRLINATVFEVDDASSFPTTVPYDVLMGENSGNVETLAVQQLSLRSRTYEVTTALVNPGDMAVVMTSLAGPSGPANQFPNGGPYRVVIEPFTGTAEVLEVVSTSAGTTLNLSVPAVNSHAIGSRVVLLADLIRVSPAGGDDHMGNVRYLDRFGLYAPEIQVGGADTVRPLYTQATLNLGGTDWSPTAANGTFNFGTGVVKARGQLAAAVSAGDTTATLASTARFPTSGYPYVITLDVGAGPLLAERLHVTNNNTGTNVLTFSHGAVFSHSNQRSVEFTPGPEENISYTTRVGAVLDFIPYLQIEHTHYEMEALSPSVGTGYPRRDGFDFPLRLPVTVQDRVQYIIDLVRAAGVEVTFISKR